MPVLWNYSKVLLSQRDSKEEGEDISMKEIVHVMLDKDTVEKRIMQLAEEISDAYQGKELRLLCILKGSVFFCCELAKYLTIPVTLDFLAVSSYGDGTQSTGKMKLKKELDESVKGVDCLVIEDIIDTGNTLAWLKGKLLEQEPASLRLCTLLDKPDRREAEVSVDYVGFEIPDEFVVGYGLDYAQKYRNLPYIGKLELINE